MQKTKISRLFIDVIYSMRGQLTIVVMLLSIMVNFKAFKLKEQSKLMSL